MKVEVVSIGDELLLAEILDTNAATITRALRALEIALTARVTVGDEPTLIADALRSGLKRADVVITVGGMGGDAGDMACQVVAEVTGRNLRQEQPGAGEAMLLGSPPEAYGVLVETEQGTIICLPDSQREVAYLLQTEVLPYLQRRLASGGATRWMVMRTAGVMESNVRELLAEVDLGSGEQLSYSSYAGYTDIRILVQAKSPRAAEVAVDRLAKMVVAQLGDHIYGRDKERLEEKLVQRLRQHRLQVAVAEHETGATVSQVLRKVPGVAKAFVFVSLSKHEGSSHYAQIEAAGEGGDLTRWCRLVAERLRRQRGADLGLMVYKKVTPGGMQILITLAADTGVTVTQRSFGGHPANIDDWAATLALVHLRRWLLAYRPTVEGFQQNTDRS